MINVAIVGCGKIADAHAWAIGQVPDSRIVGFCDREVLMAKQMAERFHVNHYFADLGEMLSEARPDVVHILTPPQSHYEIGQVCLSNNCHIYIEKPFTVNSDEASRLISSARAKGLKLTVGTDEQFSKTAILARQLIHEGYLGGMPIHLEAYYCYNLGDKNYAQAFLSNKRHWVRGLPGQLMHNVISHGIAKIAEYLQNEEPVVIAKGYTSKFLRDLGENDLIDELRVIIYDENDITAYFTFSTQMRPQLREFRVYGPVNGLLINQDNHSVIKLPGETYKSYLNAFMPLRYLAKQYRSNMYSNAKLFIKRDFHFKEGLRNLIGQFYRAIVMDSAEPIPYKEILLTTKIMDSIFAQVYQKR